MPIEANPLHARVERSSPLESADPQGEPMLQSGDLAPLFSLPDADMETFDLASLRGKQHLVLYFYLRDNTPGCTMEAADFSDRDGDFGAHDCTVIGISPDDCLTHAEFRDEHGLSIRLLSDQETEVCQLYDVWRAREVDGLRKMGVLRSTFIIDKEGVVRHALYNVSPRGHAAAVFDLVKQLDTRNGNGNRQEHRRDPQV
jgi:thioredoxin-dependent peroxiredoxin